nr:PREDICTED: uncharacterized protein LOC106702021 [Latimeria chalumnae]|eukprot:XP_014339619.1 PREDICTED: uncharacterized protein LOC106702021 [Latimeria chalumnae]
MAAMEHRTVLSEWGGSGNSSPSSGPSDLEKVMDKLQGIYRSLETLTTAIKELKDTNAGFLTRIMSVEQRVSDVEDTHNATTTQVADLQKKISLLQVCLDDQENRARRNNLHIIGFPEGAKQGKPAQFLQNILPTLLNIKVESPIEIERAHCSLASRPPEGKWLRPLIVKFLRFPVKEKLLSAARSLGKLEWQGHLIQIYLVLSKDLQDKQRLFQLVKKTLRDLNVRAETGAAVGPGPDGRWGGGNECPLFYVSEDNHVDGPNAP